MTARSSFSILEFWKLSQREFTTTTGATLIDSILTFVQISMNYEWPTTDNEDVAIFGREILIISWAKNAAAMEKIFQKSLFKRYWYLVGQRFYITVPYNMILQLIFISWTKQFKMII